MANTKIKRTVLITGCSDNSLGSALAIAFHKAGLHVYATARNPSKLSQVKALGIETIILDVLSEASIAECVNKLPSLDILVNNAGAAYSIPFSDVTIPEAKKLFDLNVWSYVAVTQAFLPLLLKSKGMIVNNTSVLSIAATPFQSVYNASKAAIAMFSDVQRLELAPFGVTVVDLKTGAVKTNIIDNAKDTHAMEIPKGSIYNPAKEAVEKTMNGEEAMKDIMSPDPWANSVVRELLKKKPSSQIWKGTHAFLVWISTLLPYGALDGTIKKMTGLDVVERALREAS